MSRAIPDLSSRQRARYGHGRAREPGRSGPFTGAAVSRIPDRHLGSCRQCDRHDRGRARGSGSSARDAGRLGLNTDASLGRDGRSRGGALGPGRSGPYILVAVRRGILGHSLIRPAVAASAGASSVVDGERYGRDLLGLCRPRVSRVVVGEALPDAADLGLTATVGGSVSFSTYGLS